MEREDIDFYISEKRKEEAKKRKNLQDRKQYLAAEYLLNRALELMNVPIKRPVEYTRNEHGKPYLEPVYGIYANWSHSGDYVLLALSDTEIGADLQETSREVKEALVRRVLQPEERAFYDLVPENRKKDIFYRYWVVKESFSKMTGLGLKLPLTEYYADISSDMAKIVWKSRNQEYTGCILPFKDAHYIAAITKKGIYEACRIEYLQEE